jgi:DNA topoisomerase I
VGILTDKKVFIVESPTKSRTISKYLGSDYDVFATGGHIIDLPKGSLGLDPEQEFEPSWQFLKGKKTLLEKIKKSINKNSIVYLATDPDREGEAIAFHLKNHLSLKEGQYRRIRLKEITKTEVIKELNSFGLIDFNLVESQFSRRILDRLVGYQLSPSLWKIQYGLSAGRVQSPVLKWICDREEEIQKFKSELYYELKGQFKDSFHNEWTGTYVDDRETKFSLEEFAKHLKEFGYSEKDLPIIDKSNLFKVNDIVFHLDSLKESHKNKFPPPPYTTSAMQKDAFNLLRFSPTKTMKIAQSLYEGKSLNKGMITYMRTDSIRVSPGMAEKTIQFLKGEGFNPIYRKNFSKKNIQDAHEAIRPTELHSIKNFPNLPPDEMKLYKLIFDRYMKSFLEPAKFLNREFHLIAEKKNFLVKKEHLIDRGFLEFDSKEKQMSEKIFPLKIGDEFLLESIEIFAKETQPPPRFKESNLIEKMEKTGIGRPSTYASTLEVLYKRGYIQKIKNEIQPTELGKIVNRELLNNYPEFLEEGFTGIIEKELDEIAKSKKKRIDFLNYYYKKLKSPNKKSIKIRNNCPSCEKGTLNEKISRNGKVYVICSSFPFCDYTKYL